MSSPQLITQGGAVELSGLVHRVRIPNTPGPYRTLILLHGRYGTEDVMWLFARKMPENWLIVAPRAYIPEAGGFSWVEPSSEIPTMASFAGGVEKMVHFMAQMPALYDADPNEFHFMGFSQGAALSLALALQQKASIKAVASLVGFVPLGADELIWDLPIENMPAFMSVGREDERVPLDLSRRSAELLLNAGADLSYEEYDVGHKLNSQGIRDLNEWWEQFVAVQE